MLVIWLKKYYNTKVTEIENKLNNHNHDKYIDTSELTNLAVDIFNARIAQANVVTKADFDAKLSGFNKNITQNKTKHLLVESESNKLKTFDSSYFIGKSRCIDHLKCFLLHSILNIFQNGNLKDYVMKVLRRFLPLIIVLIQH